jgi:hypothetical protein
MRKLKIMKRFLIDDKNTSVLMRLYLYQNYMINLKSIKKNNNLTFYNSFIKFNIWPNFTNDENKTNRKKNILDKKEYKLPDFEKELNFIREQKYKQYKEKTMLILKKMITFLNVKQILDLKNTQNNIKLIFTFFSKNIALYKLSIQELVEGQREVTQNKNFKFEDGKTVQNKMDEFEVKLKENLNIKSTNLFDKLNKK